MVALERFLFFEQLSCLVLRWVVSDGLRFNGLREAFFTKISGVLKGAGVGVIFKGFQLIIVQDLWLQCLRSL